MIKSLIKNHGWYGILLGLCDAAYKEGNEELSELLEKALGLVQSPEDEED